jgi:hypothetical protein
MNAATVHPSVVGRHTLENRGLFLFQSQQDLHYPAGASTLDNMDAFRSWLGFSPARFAWEALNEF